MIKIKDIIFLDEVAEDFTLYDLFELVAEAEQIIPGIAITFGMPHFDKFWEQINKPRDGDDTNELTCLQLYWSPDYDILTVPKTEEEIDSGRPGIAEQLTGRNENYWDDPRVCSLPNLMDLHGLGEECPEHGQEWGDCGTECNRVLYAIEYTPVNNLAHLPICVLPQINFPPPFVDPKSNITRTKFQLTIEPTLYCLITSIFWELTFAGYTPDKISGKSLEIREIMDDIKDQLERRGEFGENSDDDRS